MSNRKNKLITVTMDDETLEKLNKLTNRDDGLKVTKTQVIVHLINKEYDERNAEG